MSIWGNYRPGVTAINGGGGTDPLEPPDPVTGGVLPGPNPAPQEMTPPADPNRKWLNRQLKTRAFLEANPERRAAPMGRTATGGIALADPRDRDYNGTGLLPPPTSATGAGRGDGLKKTGAFNAAMPRKI